MLQLKQFVLQMSIGFLHSSNNLKEYLAYESVKLNFGTQNYYLRFVER